MSQANPFDQFDGHAPAPSSGVLTGPAPLPKEPREPKTTYRPLSKDEIAQRGLDPNGNYQISSEGSVSSLGSSKGPPATEFQSKSAGFYGRMLKAERDYGNIPPDKRDSRNVFGQTMHDWMPGTENSLPVWLGGNDPNRQMGDQASLDFIRASLRQESGASINADEEAKQYKIFYPMPGDSQEVIDQKAASRKQAMEGFRVASGPLAADIQASEQPSEKKDKNGDPVVATATSGNNHPPAGTNPSNPFDGLPGKSGGQAGLYDENGNFVGEDPRKVYAPGEEMPPLTGAVHGGPGYDAPSFSTGGYEIDPKTGERINLDNIVGNAAPPVNQYEADLKDALAKQGAGDPTAYQNWLMRAANGSLFGLSDEVNGLRYGLSALLKGTDPAVAYKVARDLERMRQHQNEAGQGKTGTALELAASIPTAALIPMGEGTAGAAKAGAAMGGLTGFGHGSGLEGSVREGVLGSVVGAGGGVLGEKVIGPGLVKAATSRPGQAVINAATNIPAKARGLIGNAVPLSEEGAATLAAGERQGITMRKPDLVPESRNAMAAAEASPYGGGLINNALRGDAKAVESRLTEIGGPGESASGSTMNSVVGSKVQDAGTKYIDRTRLKKNDLYGQAEQLAEGKRVIPENAIAAIDKHVTELQSAGANTNSAQIGYLKGLREDMSIPDGFGITDFQRLRSNASQKIKGDQALTASDADRRLGDITRAFTSDAEAQLPGAAASKLAEADKYYAQRQDFIGNTLKGLVGTKGKPMSAEDTGKAMMALTRNKQDHAKLSRLLDEVDPATRADYAATVAEQLGKGQNNQFSLGALATNIEKTPSNIRQTLFGKDGNQALNDLQAISRAKSETAGGLNHSRTGAVMIRDTVKRMLFSAGAGGAASGGSVAATVGAPLLTEAVTAMSQRRAAKLLLNPKFTGLIRTAPKQATPAQAQAWLDRLSHIGTSNPVISAEVSNVVPLFEKALGLSPSRLAAQEPDKPTK